MQMKYSEEFSKLGKSGIWLTCIKLIKIQITCSQLGICFMAGKHVYGLAHAASGYHKVLEENRKLYNQVQDLKGALLSFKFLLS